MIAATRMRCNKTCGVTSRLLAHSCRNCQSLRSRSLGVSVMIALGVSAFACVFVIALFCMVDSSSLTGIGVGCVRAGGCFRTRQPALLVGAGTIETGNSLVKNNYLARKTILAG